MLSDAEADFVSVLSEKAVGFLTLSPCVRERANERVDICTSISSMCMFVCECTTECRSNKPQY